MKKYVKLVPMVAATLALTGCPKPGSNPEPSYRNELQKTVAEMADGALSEAQVASLLSSSLLSTADNEATYLSYVERDETSAEYYYASNDDEDLAGAVQNLTKKLSLKSYDNGVVIADQDYECYPYDPSQKVIGTLDGEELILSTCWALVPIAFNEKTVIWKDGANANYVHSRNGNPSDPYSFKASTAVRDDLDSKIASAGGTSGIVVSSINDVKDFYTSYNSNYGTQYTFLEGMEASKEGSKVQITWHGNMRYNWYDMDAQWPGEGLTGYYMERGRAWMYTVTIEDGFVTNGAFVLDAMYRIYYHDKNGTAGPGTKTVSQEFIDTLDLEIPTEIPEDSSGAMMENPYTSYTSFEGKGYGDTYYSFTASNRSLGNYSGELPNVESFRDSDDSDEGSAFLTLEEFLG